MKKAAIITLVIILSLTGYLSYRMIHIAFDYDFEKFFPADDPDTEFFFSYRKKFESDNDYVLIGVKNNKGVFDQSFLQRTDSLAANLSEIPNIRQVLSLTTYKEYIRSSLGPALFEVPAIHISQPEKYTSDSARIFSMNQLVGSLISPDAKSLCLVLLTKEYISKAASDTLAKDIKKVLPQFHFDEIHVAGRSTGQSYYVNLMQTELMFFTFTSFILVVIFLSLSFRTLWGVVVPIVVVVFTAIWIVGFMNIVGEGINLVLTILPTIMFVVGMSDVVHVISKYIEELRDGHPKMEALRITYKEVALATFLTSLTTAIGFLTLLTSRIEPVRDFGFYTAIGVFFAYVLAYTLLPAVLILSPQPKIAAIPHESTLWQKILRGMLRYTIRHRRGILVVSAVVLAISVYGISRIRINNFLLEDLSADNELKQEFVFFEKEFSGARPFEMAFLLKEKSPDHLLSISGLRELEKMENYLQSDYGVGFIVSVNELIKKINQNNHSGNPDYFRLPDTQEELDKLVDLLAKYKSDEVLKKFVADHGSTLRISGKLDDLGSFYYRHQNEKLQTYFESHFNSKRYDYKLTGTAVLIDKNNGQLSSGLVLGLIISFGAIALIVGLMYYSWRMILLSLIPNILPVIMIGAIMGFVGVDLKVSTSMIFTIAFGIAVDDTIHFISKLRLELNKGKSVIYAIKRTYLTTGRAIIYTTIILSGGFLTLVFSSFLGTYYIGLLVGLTLIFAVLGDLFLLPVLLLYFYRKK